MTMPEPRLVTSVTAEEDPAQAMSRGHRAETRASLGHHGKRLLPWGDGTVSTAACLWSRPNHLLTPWASLPDRPSPSSLSRAFQDLGLCAAPSSPQAPQATRVRQWLLVVHRPSVPGATAQSPGQLEAWPGSGAGCSDCSQSPGSGCRSEPSSPGMSRPNASPRSSGETPRPPGQATPKPHHPSPVPPLV